MRPAIAVERLSKKYTINHTPERYISLRDVIAGKAVSFFKKSKKLLIKTSTVPVPKREDFWALKDLNFEINQGDRVGIIGRNGAGKSTLLKVLSRITEPTSGKIKIKGRVASLLEVGTGFHPELTGRENIFLNGAIMGMSRAEIIQKFDEIVDFSGVEKFLDTPVKRYSSGMYVRLAFAVAAHLEPEILIIDEVLAVGDVEFQRKCLGKMEEVSKSDGRTVLFVSHNMQAISSLTASCIVLANGQLNYYGDTHEGINHYLRLNAQNDTVYSDHTSATDPKIRHVQVHSSEPDNVQAYGKSMSVSFTVYTPRPLTGAAVSFQIINSLQQSVTHILILDAEQPFCREEGVYHLTCEIPKTRLYPDRYALTIHFAEKGTDTKFQTIENVCPFEIVVLNQIRDYYWSKNAATYVEDSYWKVEKSNAYNEVKLN